MTFCCSHSDPDPAFQPIANVRVLYIYVSISFIQGRCDMPYSLQVWKRKKHWNQCRAEMGFLCEMRLQKLAPDDPEQTLQRSKKKKKKKEKKRIDGKLRFESLALE